MSPRHRSITNQHIAQLAAHVLTERGPDAVTFAEVSQQCGLAPPTLVQRFGSRNGLLAITAEALTDRVKTTFHDERTDQPALQRLLTTLQSLAAMQLNAALLSTEIEMSAYSLELRKQISFALADAVEASELPRCDVAQLARTIQIAFAGAVTTAALERGDAAAEIADAVGGQLAVYV